VRALARALWVRLVTLWQLLRALSGDDAYERYCAHQAQQHAGQPLLSRRSFYLHSQQRKWSGVSRCC